MTQANERTATLSALVAEEIRALMARRKMSGRDLAAQLGVSPSWISYRLSGKQPIDLNDMASIAHALGVGVHQLLPAPDIAARAAEAQATLPKLGLPECPVIQIPRPRDNRPAGHPVSGAGAGSGRTAYVSRTARHKRDR